MASRFGIEDRNIDGCGLFKIDKNCKSLQLTKKPQFQLLSVSVDATVVHSVVQVKVTQLYLNHERIPVEAIYYFPLTHEGNVTHFQVEMEGGNIQGSVKPCNEAIAAYNDAVGSQKTLFTAEEIKADFFIAHVGLLTPSAEVKIIIVYLKELKNKPGSKSIQFYIPNSIAPRFVSEDIGNSKANFSQTGELTLKVAILLQGKIKSVSCPTHKVKVELRGPTPDRPTWDKAIVELTTHTTRFIRDFVLNLEPEEPHQARLYSEKQEDGSTALMLHFVPSFTMTEQKTEFIFMLDRSGSMIGESIDLARKALLLLLHSLPGDCFFNVIGFGSTHQCLYKESVRYNYSSLKEAAIHVWTLDADLGGTEIYKPLEEVYTAPKIDGYLRQIFILTCGEVPNTDAVLGLIQTNAHKCRVFALGIGEEVSQNLVDGIAKVGGGTSSILTYNESIHRIVLKQLKNSLQPTLTDVELEWVKADVESLGDKLESSINKLKTTFGYNKPAESASTSENIKCDGFSIGIQTPKHISPIYNGSQLLAFGIYKDKVPIEVRFKAKSPDGPISDTISIGVENQIGTNRLIHKLAASNLLRELELEMAVLEYSSSSLSPWLRDTLREGERLKNEIIAFGCKYGLTSKFTSFVAIDLNTGKPSKNVIIKNRHIKPPLEDDANVGAHSDTPLVDITQKIMDSLKVNEDRGPRRSSAFSRTLTETKFKWSLPRRPSKEPQPPHLNSPEEKDVKKANRMLVISKLFNRKKSQKSPQQIKVDKSKCENPAKSGPASVIGKNSVVTQAESSISEVQDSSQFVVRLVSLQSFDGSFNLDNDLCTILDKNLNDLQRVAMKHGLEENELATALGVAYFTLKFGNEKELWDPVVTKAQTWLESKPSRLKSKKLMELAYTLV